MPKYRIEVTDTFGGQANYAWVNRYTLEAKSLLGAVRKVGKREGIKLRFAYEAGDAVRYDAVGAAICAHIEELEEAT